MHTLKSFKFTFWQSIIFEIIYKMLTFTVFVPLISFVFRQAIHISGHAGATNYELLKFAYNPVGIVCILFIICFATVIIFVEFSVLILISYYGHQRKIIKLMPAFLQAISHLPSLFRYGFVGWIVYFLLIMPLLNLGLSSSLLPSLQIPNFVSGELLKTSWGMILSVVLIVVVAILNIRWMMSLHMIVIEGKEGFIESSRKSVRMMRKSYWKMILTLLYGLLLFLLLTLILIVILILLVFAISFFVQFEILMDHPLFNKIIVSIIVLSIFIASFIASPFFIHTLTTFYLEKANPYDAAIRHLDWDQTKNFYAKENRSLVRAYAGKLVLFASIVIAVTLLLYPLNNAARLKSDSFMIMAHRGDITMGVENSLEALQGAIDAKADYAEIDVQLTKDGQLAVIHDTNLKRLTGRNASVYELTMDELRELELSQGNFTGRIHSLEDFIQKSKGKIKLNIEIKLHGSEQGDIVKMVVDLLRKYKVVEEYVVQSLDREVVKQVQDEEPAIKTGYIVFASTGMLSWVHADFIVLEEYMVTEEAISSAKMLNKPLYVWTVNDTSNIEKYYNMGADGIITDIPDIAQDIVNQLRK
ncbi:glycerophosphodiester phosphodiesterase [Paenibacillus sp. N1-5-1-14]|nr:glycerophosphodiester phosphodiesterase [Paenibacillus radicibacter]